MAGDSGDKAQEKASEGISQLSARILSQLALSAWLPSACLVLATAFILSLGNAADAKGRNTLHEVTQAFETLGDISFHGIILIFVAVVIATMLTQAFTFEAIRILEGYWGASWLAEQAARAFCAWHRWWRGYLQRRLDAKTQEAWDTAEPRLRSLTANGRLAFNEVKLEYLRQLLGVDRTLGNSIAIPDQKAVEGIKIKDKAYLEKYVWTTMAPSETIRQRANLEKRLGDYPAATRILPTRLGNVLRHYEDKTGVPKVESMVDEVYDRLPFSLKVSHDEQRGRLDLYCSMTFVWLALIVVEAARLAWFHPWYAATCAALTLLASLASYRAAVASARYYGELLLQIAAYHPSKTSEPLRKSRLLPGPALLWRLIGGKHHGN